MKPICMYLPQYHTFPENDEWWGRGYTEWTAVKAAEPLFEGHLQPRVPLEHRYYDLVNEAVTTFTWQASLAKKYGIYGFSFYMYWFRGTQLMERPLEILHAHPEIDLKYCICWANESWTRTWYGLANQVLIRQEYGFYDDWKMHFDYLLHFFMDERYIKVGNRPVLQIYRTFDIEELAKMRELFDEWAVEAGFDGIYLIGGKTAADAEKRDGIMDAWYYFEPGYSLKHDLGIGKKLRYNLSVLTKTMLNKFRKTKRLEREIPAEWIYRAIEKRNYAKNEFPGLIPNWDNTPRRKYKGLIYKGTNPARFEEVLRTLSEKVSGDREDFVFINAWNEWGEGAVMEPDEADGYGYLQAVANVQGIKPEE
ncbi:MAG: glycoside hydrolase family 99-like domain-containing protein [Lachnospiraceae bacterium]|nr:glycoside hydrolase family 99-like domain-containing protein [Lachnospiraceae bacterium]